MYLDGTLAYFVGLVDFFGVSLVSSYGIDGSSTAGTNAFLIELKPMPILLKRPLSLLIYGILEFEWSSRVCN